MSTREEVRDLFDQGLAQVEIARRLGVSPSTVSAHVRALRPSLAPVCAIKGCRAPIIADDLCDRHLARRVELGACRVSNCEKPISRPALGWCEMHYYRHRRHGDINVETVRVPKVERRIDRGYVVLRLPDHPLSNGSWVYEHRYVLYELLGPADQQCWWCDEPIAWHADLNVDHLDYDRSNNDPANLVVSCRACNMGRGAGCDPEGWAIAMATRRVLARHRPEFVREVETMRARLEAVPAREASSTRHTKAQQAHNAARSVFEDEAAAGGTPVPRDRSSNDAA